MLGIEHYVITGTFLEPCGLSSLRCGHLGHWRPLANQEGCVGPGNQEVDGLENDFSPSFFGLGGNLTLADFIFAEGHLGNVGDGPGFRGFAGITLERLMKKGLDLPFNVLIGSELFYGSEAAGEGNSTGWAGFGARLDIGF